MEISTVSLEEAYRAHSGAVEAHARRLCGPHAAPDVTQEVFLRLARRPHAFDPAKGTLRSFLMGIGQHVAADHVRSERSRRDRQVRAHVGASDVAPDPSVEVTERLQVVELRRLLDRLPHDERDAIVAAFLGGRTYREAAAELGRAEGTVKSRIRRGLHRLRTIAAEEALASSAS